MRALFALVCLTIPTQAFACDLADMVGWTLIARKTIEGRIRICPGKRILSMFREWVQDTYGVTLTIKSITSKLTKNDLAPDLINILKSIDEFRMAQFSDATE